MLGRPRRTTSGEEAFEALFRREFAPLVRALTLVAGDREAAADAVQDAFVQAHRHRDRVLGLESPTGWLRHVALNRIRNQHRGQQREAAALPRLVDAESSSSASSSSSSSVLDVDAMQAATSLVASLPPQQRSAAAMYYLLDQTTAAIAERLGVTEATVRSHLRAARKRLHEQLEEGAS